MKRIGILTFHFVNNCGAMLQCIALQKVLNELGEVDVTVINYQPKYLVNMYQPIINPFMQAKALARSFSNRSRVYRVYRYLRNICSSIVKNLHFFERYRRQKIFQDYYQKQLRLSNKCVNSKDLASECGEYDVYIVGSDQVWNSHITNYDIDFSYYLDFLTDKTCKRITYAVSASFNDTELERIMPYIRRFDTISFREKKAYEQLSASIGYNKLRVDIDPTFLLTRDDYRNFEEKIEFAEKSVVIYDLPSNDKKKILNVARNISSEMGIPLVDISPIHHYGIKNAEKIVYFTPGQFLSIIKKASYIVTNSYHGIVFSIIYNREFFVIQPSLHSERVSYLLKELNLEERVVHDSPLDIKKIDWGVVNGMLEKKRIQSLSYLKRETLG